MSKAIKIYAISPDKDYGSIGFFFKNLDVFKRYKKQILINEEACTTKITGMGVCGLLIGEYPVCLGELMTLYEDAWKFEQNGDTRYLIHMAGSPFSGGNQCSFWSIRKKKIVYGGVGSFSEAFSPLMNLRKEQTHFTLNDDELPEELEKLLVKLADFHIEFRIKQAEEAEKRKAAERLSAIVEPNVDRNGVNALMRYCQAGDLSAVELIWKHSRKQFYAKTKKGLTPVNFAAKQFDALQFLVKHKKTAFIGSPIASACEVKDDVGKRLDLLFGIGADVNAKNDDGEPPIVVAAEAFNIKAIRWLLKHGADKRATNANGETARDIVLKNKDVFNWQEIPELL